MKALMEVFTSPDEVGKDRESSFSRKMMMVDFWQVKMTTLIWVSTYWVNYCI